MNKIYYSLPGIIIFTALGVLFIAYQINIHTYTLRNIIITSLMITTIPAALATFLVRGKSIPAPPWYQPLTTSLPQPYLFLTTYLLSIIIITAYVPIIRIPFGIIASFILHLFLRASITYSTTTPSQKRLMQTIYYLQFIAGIILIFAAPINYLLTGNGSLF